MRNVQLIRIDDDPGNKVKVELLSGLGRNSV